MSNLTIKNPGRREFLRTVPAAAAAGLALTDASLLTEYAAAQEAATAPATYQVFTAQTLQDDIQALEAKPGNNTLFNDKTFSVVLTTETAHSAKEFEWHEGRDHVFEIFDGSTVFELGGTPKNAHSTGPGEWLAPESEGAATVTLHKGDMLVIPRGTPHKRSTPGSVTFTLTSPMGTAKA
jgi:mannose-6-phosphate isomerase-like protein (cupin superfamily)